MVIWVSCRSSAHLTPEAGTRGIVQSAGELGSSLWGSLDLRGERFGSTTGIEPWGGMPEINKMVRLWIGFCMVLSYCCPS